MEAGKKWDLLSLASIPLIMTLGNSMLIPILPSMRDKLGVSSLQVSLIITVYSAVAIVLIPLAGYFSDRFGRKIIIIPSLIIAALGGLLSGLAAWWLNHPYGWILAGRFLQGMGAAGAAPIVMPLVGDLFKKESDVSSGLGIIETSNTLGKVLSPILGSALALLVWFLPFLAIPVICIISVLLVSFFVKTPKDASEQKKDKNTFTHFLGTIKQLFKQKGRWLYAVFAIGCICMFVIFSTLFYLSDVLEDTFNIDGIIKGCILAIPQAALCVASFAAGKIIGRHKKRMKWTTFIGLVLLTGSMFFCTRIGVSIYLLISLLCLAGFGIGASLPALDAMITEGIEKEQRGTVTSIYSSMRFLGVAMGPPIASLLLRFSPAIMFYIISVVCLVSALLAFFAIKPKRNEVEEETEEETPPILIDNKART
jgi:MFS transporter, ACDE family, multidrug resistance protein